jgi:uncharacterized metal-binding protein
MLDREVIRVHEVLVLFRNDLCLFLLFLLCLSSLSGFFNRAWRYSRGASHRAPTGIYLVGFLFLIVLVVFFFLFFVIFVIILFIFVRIAFASFVPAENDLAPTGCLDR